MTQPPGWLCRRRVLVMSMLVTFAAMRAWLHVRPQTDLDIGPYNIHHLFTGVVILTAFAIPAVLRPSQGRRGAAQVAGFGVGLSLVLDEWFYLIVTDGSNAAYVQWPSLLGGATAVLAACLYALAYRRADLESLATRPDAGVPPSKEGAVQLKQLL
jgi:hypothetical protein